MESLTKTNTIEKKKKCDKCYKEIKHSLYYDRNNKKWICSRCYFNNEKE
jgi:hypothetical protein